MIESMRRFLVENGLDPDNDEVKRAAENLESDFVERMAGTQDVLVGARADGHIPRCTQNTGPGGGDTIQQCVLRADHKGPHLWERNGKPRDEYRPEEFME